MATNYSYICWGGRTGKSVTVNSSTDYVTLTNHGLRDGKGVAFASGTLPTVAGTALALNTTYYAKKISSSTFELYYDAGLTSKINFTSTGSSLILKGAHFLALANPSRYGPAGAERIYDGLNSFATARASVALPSDYEICEIGEAFDDTLSANVSLNFGASATLVTTMVNGARSEAFHNGVVGAGYIAWRSEGSSYYAIICSGYNTSVDGFTVRAIAASTSGIRGVYLARPSCWATRMIAIGPAGFLRGIGFYMNNAYTHCVGCLAVGFGIGFAMTTYQYGVMMKNNLAAKNAVGFGTESSSNQYYGIYINNISIGNTTNWASSVSGFERASNNAGESGNSPWVTSTNPTITMATTDFVDFDNNDFRPASFTSPQVEAGMYLFGAEFDLADNFRPNYTGPLYGTSVAAGSFVTGLVYTIEAVGTTDFTAIGASANTVGVKFKATGAGSGDGTAILDAVFDVGCFEYDHSYGDWPATATIELSNIVSGSRVLITRDDTSAVLYNDVPGGSLSFSTQYIGAFTVIVRKASASPYYREFTAGGSTVADQTTSIKILQQLDE